MALIFQEYTFSSQDIGARVNEILELELPLLDPKESFRSILSLIDLTTLSGDDTDQRVLDLCAKGREGLTAENGIGPVAAICVYPVFTKLVSEALKGSGLKTASVAGGFPSGQSPLNVRVAEVEHAIRNGADEIDMVISRGRLIQGDDDFVTEEIRQIKAACGEAHLKVILETGELKTPELIRRASVLAINAGADFIKTSTGKVEPAATTDAFLIMLDTIKEYFELTGKMIGIKPAGGISEPDQALVYYAMVKHVLGDKWLNNKYLRIGASRLADKIFNELTK